jgi:hypothetical protein
MRYKDVTLYTSFELDGRRPFRARLSARPLHTSEPEKDGRFDARVLWGGFDRDSGCALYEEWCLTSCYGRGGFKDFGYDEADDERRALRWLLDGGCEGVDE